MEIEQKTLKASLLKNQFPYLTGFDDRNHLQIYVIIEELYFFALQSE